MVGNGWSQKKFKTASFADKETTQKHSWGQQGNKGKEAVQDLTLVSDQQNWIGWRYNALKYEPPRVRQGR